MSAIQSITIGAALALSLAATTLPAQAQQKLLPAQSEIVFVSKQMGVPVEGRFKKFDAQVAFDPAKPETSKIALTVDIASATIGPEADAELPKAPWFNTAKFPQATFQSSSIKSLGSGKFEVAGKLSIKGASQDVSMPVTLSQSGASTIASGVLPIKRLTFKIGDGEWADTSMVADEVQVKFKIALSGVAKF
jgi:polyisoprenoid-binding protein YceI